MNQLSVINTKGKKSYLKIDFCKVSEIKRSIMTVSPLSELGQDK